MRKTITRKELDSKLRNLVRTSKTSNIVCVDVYAINNSYLDLDTLVGYAWSKGFHGRKMKDDLFSFLMDKSLTSRIVDVQTTGTRGLLYLRIYMFSRDEGPLKRTNIDGKTMRMFEKMRYVS